MLIVVLTAFTLVAFAGNSLLCRMALGGNLIDPISFTTVRLASGALVLLPISRWLAASERRGEAAGSWGSAITLFVYAIPFSLAYVSLSAGLGALILFGSVQITMIGAALRSGDRLNLRQWVGLTAALLGLICLVFPGISAPDPLGALLMCMAGIAWGVYSLRGRGSSAPVGMTAGNFLRAVPMVGIAAVLGASSSHLQRSGVVLALASGTITSGLGYILWYRVLRDLTRTQASVVQLLVPVVAAFGGVVFLSEHISLRLLLASALILGGVAITVLGARPVRLSKG